VHQKNHSKVHCNMPLPSWRKRHLKSFTMSKHNGFLFSHLQSENYIKSLLYICLMNKQPMPMLDCIWRFCATLKHFLVSFLISYPCLNLCSLFLICAIQWHFHLQFHGFCQNNTKGSLQDVCRSKAKMRMEILCLKFSLTLWATHLMYWTLVGLLNLV
jgi:hypothetical protein